MPKKDDEPGTGPRPPAQRCPRCRKLAKPAGYRYRCSRCSKQWSWGDVKDAGFAIIVKLPY